MPGKRGARTSVFQSEAAAGPGWKASMLPGTTEYPARRVEHANDRDSPERREPDQTVESQQDRL